MKKLLALAAACTAMVPIPFALAQTQGQSTTTPEVSTQSCTPIKAIYSEKNWRKRNPMRRQTPCLSGNRKRVRQHFELYRRYRLITPYRCQHGSRGTWAIPCSVIECESHFSWAARNSSGAAGAYQLMPEWGAPYPARSFREQVQNHEIAHSLSLSNWACA